MGFKDRLLAALTLAGIDDEEGAAPGEGDSGEQPRPAEGQAATGADKPKPAPAQPQPAATASEVDALRRELAAQQAANRKLQAERIEERATAFANQMIRAEHRATPAEFDSIVAAYTQAATDDATVGTVGFADGGSRVKLLEQAYLTRDKNGIPGDVIAQRLAELAIATNRETPPAHTGNAPLSAEQVDEMLKLTAMGRSALAERNGKGK